jgi:hypothetical protein
VAAKFVEVMKEAGLPDGVLQFIPGDGGEIGDYLVEHPKIKISISVYKHRIFPSHFGNDPFQPLLARLYFCGVPVRSSIRTSMKKLLKKPSL